MNAEGRQLLHRHRKAITVVSRLGFFPATNTRICFYPAREREATQQMSDHELSGLAYEHPEACSFVARHLLHIFPHSHGKGTSRCVYRRQETLSRDTLNLQPVPMEQLPSNGVDPKAERGTGWFKFFPALGYDGGSRPCACRTS